MAGILCYKFPNQINPYGGMSPERKALVDIDGLRRSILWIMVATGIAFLLLAVFHKYLAAYPILDFWAIMGICVAMLVAVLIAMKRHNGWGKDKEGTTYRHDTNRSRIIVISVCGAIATIAFVVVTLSASNKPSVIDIQDDMLHIAGMYGRDIPVNDIVTMEVLDEMPVMAMRTNGSSFKNKNKGHFLTQNDEKCLLFVTYNGGPYIELRTADDLIYLNRETPEETTKLIDELKRAMQ
ncbi:MAG: DUF3784 domain-containing protein [Bacteroidales bacterium]|nr:DUF3784 domain-containing protein [Bacteroidales bacterium]